MDKELKQLEQELARYDQARGADLTEAWSDDSSPRYVRNLERRASRLGVAAEEIYRQDQNILSGARPTEDCFRAEQIMVAARDPNALRAESSAHLRDCIYCRNIVAAARPDVAQHTKLVAAMATPVAESAPRFRSRGQSQVASRTDNVFRVLDRCFAKVIHYGLPAAAGCYLLLAAIVPAVNNPQQAKIVANKADPERATVHGAPKRATREGVSGFAAVASGEALPIDPSVWQGVKFGALVKDAGGIRFRVNGDAAAPPTDVGRVLFVVYAPPGSEQAAEANWPMLEQFLAATASWQSNPGAQAALFDPRRIGKINPATAKELFDRWKATESHDSGGSISVQSAEVSGDSQPVMHASAADSPGVSGASSTGEQ